MTVLISNSVEKDFLSTFYIPLPGYPVSYHIDNVVMRCEPGFKDNILIFGKYDLVLCYPSKLNDLEPGYNATNITRTFCEPILFTSPDALEMPSEIIDIQAAFGQPLHVQIRLGKPSNLKPWELLKSLLLRKIWVEVLVESQIIAEITKGHRNTDLEFEESQPQTRDGTTASQDDTAIQRQEAVIDLEALAGEVQKIISRYEKERAAGVYGKMAELEQKIHGLIQEAKAAIDPEALAEQVQKIISLRQEADAVRDGADRQDSGEPAALRPDAAPIGQGEPEALTAAQVTELVLKIIHAREAARAAQEQHQLRYPPGIGQAHFIASGPEGARYPQAPAQAVTVRRPPPVPMQAPLEQIPSRPGLNPVINNPPPKPPGAGG